jgi:hypothetical protein
LVFEENDKKSQSIIETIILVKNAKVIQQQKMILQKMIQPEKTATVLLIDKYLFNPIIYVGN